MNEYKRRNRILCDKVDNLKKKIQSNKSMENEDNQPFFISLSTIGHLLQNYILDLGASSNFKTLRVI